MTQAAKIERKLYIGNLPQGISQRELMDLINEAMQSLARSKGWKLEQGNTVVSSWMSTDGHYGFVEFRTAEEANLGFNL